jgi:hypothetical protein
MVAGMVTRDTPETIAQYRQVTAACVLEGRFDLNQYPFRHIGVLASRGGAAERMAAALAAADVLGQWGWELVGVTEMGASHATYAVMRRR